MFRMFALLVALAAVLPDSAEAGSRRWRARSLCVQQSQSVNHCATHLVASPAPTRVDRGPTCTVEENRTRTVETSHVVCDGVSCRQRSVSVVRTQSTAQARADRLAALDPGTSLQPGHHAQLGPVSGFEGLGYGQSPDEATRNCCYWGQRTPREIGTAQGHRGWYAVVLYD